MTQAQVKREIKSIKERINVTKTKPLTNIRLDLMSEEEKEVCDKAVEIVERLRERGAIKLNETDPNLIQIVASKEEHKILEASAKILEKYSQ